MLENKTVNNIVDRYHRIITGDQSQIELGIQPEGTIQITQNGLIDVTQYANANINIGLPTRTITIKNEVKRYNSSTATYEDTTFSFSYFSILSHKVEYVTLGAGESTEIVIPATSLSDAFVCITAQMDTSKRIVFKAEERRGSYSPYDLSSYLSYTQAGTKPQAILVMTISGLYVGISYTLAFISNENTQNVNTVSYTTNGEKSVIGKWKATVNVS